MGCKRGLGLSMLRVPQELQLLLLAFALAVSGGRGLWSRRPWIKVCRFAAPPSRYHTHPDLSGFVGITCQRVRG